MRGAPAGWVEDGQAGRYPVGPGCEALSDQEPIALAPRDLLILSVLSTGPLHGYGIVRAVEERSDSGVLLDPANLYRVLRRMQREGWIREANDSDEDGRRRTFGLTRTGTAILRAEVARLERLLGHVRPALAGGGEGEGA